MKMPTSERRFYLGQRTKEIVKLEEDAEKLREQQKGKSSKGSRTTKISGDALKNKIKSGEIPLK